MLAKKTTIKKKTTAKDKPVKNKPVKKKLAKDKPVTKKPVKKKTSKVGSAVKVAKSSAKSSKKGPSKTSKKAPPKKAPKKKASPKKAPPQKASFVGKTVVKKKAAASSKLTETSKPKKSKKAVAGRESVKVASASNKKKAGASKSGKAIPKPASGVNGGQGTFMLGKAASLIPDEPLTEGQLRKAKSGLSRKELTQYRRALLEKRADLLGDVESLDKLRNSSVGNVSHVPLHMADVGSDNYEQEFTLGLVESEGRMLMEINEALDRMSKKYYGVCIESGRPIGTARLDIQPWAKYCIEVVRERERNGQY